MGRRLKMTDPLTAVFLDAITKGHTIRDAACLAGTTDSTVYRWLAMGREAKSGRYREFYEAYERRLSRNIDVLMSSTMAAATEMSVKKTIHRRTVKGPDGQPIRGPDGKLVVEVDEREEQVLPDGRLALEIISRKRPNEWGRRMALEHSGPATDAGPAPIQVTFVKPPERDADGQIIVPGTATTSDD